jgi:hypothetical protein
MRIRLLAFAVLYSSVTTSEAAVQMMPVKTQQWIHEGARERCQITRPSIPFRIEIVSDEEGLKAESARGRHSFITARPDERYAVRLYNPLPVRVAVNLTVDGLNSIDGKPSGIRDGQKWLIDPYGEVTIRGWQVNGEESRRFFFTDKPKSYAKWQGNRMNLKLSANCGVIGAAFFWNQAELNAHYRANPVVQYQGHSGALRHELRSKGAGLADMAPAYESAGARSSSRAMEKQEAGTGMGEREVHPVMNVAFHYDTGMYSARDAILVYYDFAREPEPNPFPALSYAPEMP